MKKTKVVKMNFRDRCEVYEVAEKMHGLKESIGINRCRSYEKPIRNRNLQVLRIM